MAMLVVQEESSYHYLYLLDDLKNPIKCNFMTSIFTKPELLQLNRAQFTSLGIFVCKKVGN